MTKYLVAVHRPNNYAVSASVKEEMSRDIDALNEEMQSAGIRTFVGGLRPTSTAKSLRTQPNGEVMATDGPYLMTTDYVDGFWVLEAAHLDEALNWGRKAAVACRAHIEVRAFY